MVNVYLPRAQKEITDKLTSKRDLTSQSVFQNNMYLMLFAAMVGHSVSDVAYDAATFERGTEVNSEVFETAVLDGAAYLLALHEEGTGEILREGRESDCWGVIQKYAHIGMEEIEQWMRDQPTDNDGVDTILFHMKNEATKLIAVEEEESPITITV